MEYIKPAMLLALLMAAVTGGVPLAAQVCRISAAGLNQNRRVAGAIRAECPVSVHTAPFGNWGVTSNFGPKGNSRQFDGWCHDSVTCDNSGACRVRCTDGWYEWNSCTDAAPFRAPNCSLYNSAACTEQVSTTGINVHGTRTVDLPVSCPGDTDGDGAPDTGGCSDIAVFTNGTNFLSLYELDPGTGDSLIQTVYFPEAPVIMNCTPLGCGPAGSNWVAPVGWDSPSTPAKVYAELAVAVNYGTFVDTSGRCATAEPRVLTVSAASYRGPEIAPDSIASVFGSDLETVAPSVRLRDSRGLDWEAPVFYASPTQINFLVPSPAAIGPVSLGVARAGGSVASGSAAISAVAPGLFSASGDGQGVAAAYAIRVNAGGGQEYVPIYECAGFCAPIPLDLNAPAVYLILYGTGIRHASNVALTIAGVPAEVAWFGAHGQYAGLDQINALVPASLAGSGVVDVVLTANGRPSNTVRIQVR